MGFVQIPRKETATNQAISISCYLSFPPDCQPAYLNFIFDDLFIREEQINTERSAALAKTTSV